MVRVAYQIPSDVKWQDTTAALCGRTLEEAFGLENAVWCQGADQRHLGLRIKVAPLDAAMLAEALHKRVTGSAFDKTKFALGVLAEPVANWNVPLYIREGLYWLKDQIKLEIEHESVATTQTITPGAVANFDTNAPGAA